MNEVEQYANYLMHFGRSKRHGAPGPGSGRYPLGSGEEPYQYRDREGALTEDGKKKLKNLKKEAKLSLNSNKLNEIHNYKKIETSFKLEPKYKNDMVLKKGSTAYRMSSNPEEKDGPAYIYFTEHDMENYGSLDFLGGQKHYKNVYKIKKDIKIPSLENITKTYIDVVLKNSDSIESVMDDVFKYNESIYKGNDDLKDISTSTTYFIDQYSNKSANDFCDEVKKNVYSSAYKYVASELKGTQNSISDTGKKLLKALSNQGYNAIPDFNDNAGIRYADSDHVQQIMYFPLFVFDRNISLKREKVIDAFNSEEDAIEYNRPRYTMSAIDSDGKRKTFDQYGREYVKKKIKQ